MTTITQNGYRFVYRNKRKGQLPITETWDIERVAAFMFLVEFYRMRSQRYVGSFTFVAAVGSIQYELEEFDKETNHDIDKLTRLLIPYTSDELCVMWFTSFDKALNMAEKMIKERVAREEAPLEVFGKLTYPKRFCSRPTEEEYAARAEEEKKQAGITGPTNGILKVWFHMHGVIPCRVVKETDTWYWVDGYVNGKVVVANARVKKGTSRIISE